MAPDTRDYWVLGLGPSFGILKNSVLETGSVSVLCWVCKKELTPYHPLT
jgi:hypothetical protein